MLLKSKLHKKFDRNRLTMLGPQQNQQNFAKNPVVEYELNMFQSSVTFAGTHFGVENF